MTLPTAGQVATALYERFEARDWESAALLLAVDVVYCCPQTRERVTGREALIDYMRSYPGDWHLAVARVVATDSEAAVVVDATVDGGRMQSVALFDVGPSGLITGFTDYWPESYDRPASRAHLSELY